MYRRGLRKFGPPEACLVIETMVGSPVYPRALNDFDLGGVEVVWSSGQRWEPLCRTNVVLPTVKGSRNW